MARSHTHQYYFNRTHDLRGYEHISTCGALILDHICGETIAAALCDNDSALELVRFRRANETIIVHRRLTDIKVDISMYS